MAGTRELVEGRKRLADGGLRDIRSRSRIHRIPFLLCFPPRGRVTRTRPRVPFGNAPRISRPISPRFPPNLPPMIRVVFFFPPRPLIRPNARLPPFPPAGILDGSTRNLASRNLHRFIIYSPIFRKWFRRGGGECLYSWTRLGI